MIAHGLSTGALFLLAGYMEQRRGSLEISEFGGIATPAPRLATAFMIALLASIGLPTLCNFIGEFLVLQGAAIANFPGPSGPPLASSFPPPTCCGCTSELFSARIA